MVRLLSKQVILNNTGAIWAHAQLHSISSVPMPFIHSLD